MFSGTSSTSSTLGAPAGSAARSLSGVFSARVQALAAGIVELRMLVEATLDFPEEEIDFLEKARAAERSLPSGTRVCVTANDGVATPGGSGSSRRPGCPPTCCRAETSSSARANRVRSR